MQQCTKKGSGACPCTVLYCSLFPAYLILKHDFIYVLKSAQMITLFTDK